MLRKKKRTCVVTKRTQNYNNFKKLSRSITAAIHQHRRCKESRLIFARDLKSFFSYIHNMSNSNHDLQLSANNVILLDADAANGLLQEFDNIFLHSNQRINNRQLTSLISASSDLRLKCTQDMVARAICDCRNTNNDLDGVFYRPLKFIKNIFIIALSIIFQHFIYEGVFPHIWKHVVIMPLHKGCGDKSAVCSYRPISLCSCIRKLLEKVVTLQQNAHLHGNGLLQQAQHGVISGRSTLTDLLTTDAYIGQLATTGHVYDIIKFDFAKAFDKAPLDAIINALSEHVICGTPLKQFDRFLTGRTQQVCVGESYSSSAQVTSGIIQGSVARPGLYSIFIDSQLQAIRLPSAENADDIKFIVTSRYTAQPRYKQKLIWLCSGQILTMLLPVLISAVFFTAASNRIITYTIR